MVRCRSAAAVRSGSPQREGGPGACGPEWNARSARRRPRAAVGVAYGDRHRARARHQTPGDMRTGDQSRRAAAEAALQRGDAMSRVDSNAVATRARRRAEPGAPAKAGGAAPACAPLSAVAPGWACAAGAVATVVSPTTAVVVRPVPETPMRLGVGTDGLTALAGEAQRGWGGYADGPETVVRAGW